MIIFSCLALLPQRIEPHPYPPPGTELYRRDITIYGDPLGALGELLSLAMSIATQRTSIAADENVGNSV